MFDAATGLEMAAFEPVGADAWDHSGPEYALSADGSTLAFVPKPDYSRGGRIVVWDVDAGKTFAEFPGLPPLALTTDGGMIAHGDVDHLTANCWPCRRIDGGSREALGCPAPLVQLYVGFGFGLAPKSLEIHEVRLYNATTGRFLTALPLRNTSPYPLLEFSPDSRTLVVRYFAPTHVNFGHGAVNND